MPDEVVAGGLEGALMLQLLVRVAHTDDSASPFSDKAREEFGELAFSVVFSLWQSLSLLVVMMKSKQLKIKISHAHSMILSLHCTTLS